MSLIPWSKIQKEKYLVIENKVYDVSNFKYNHPGGESIIDQWVGKDATQIFSDVGHSKHAVEILKSLYIGDLDANSIRVETTNYNIHVLTVLVALISIMIALWFLGKN